VPRKTEGGCRAFKGGSKMTEVLSVNKRDMDRRDIVNPGNVWSCLPKFADGVIRGFTGILAFDYLQNPLKRISIMKNSFR
jgi:hypothetical protein